MKESEVENWDLSGAQIDKLDNSLLDRFVHRKIFGLSYRHKLLPYRYGMNFCDELMMFHRQNQVHVNLQCWAEWGSRCVLTHGDPLWPDHWRIESTGLRPALALTRATAKLRATDFKKDVIIYGSGNELFTR